MADPIRLCSRGIRYIKQYGVRQLYIKVSERKMQNRLEAEYDAWFHSQVPGKEELARQHKKVFSTAPLISVIVPAYETPEKFLREMIDSVLNQSYEKLELCIADGSPGDSVKAVVEQYMEKDRRIVYTKLPENLGIAENTNAALALATGDYIGLLDHDDVLALHALYEIAEALESNREIDVLYSDEDKVNFNLTHHFQPHFKPDFNLDLLRSNNYICHFFVVRRDIVDEITGFRSAFDGAQDYDFILRCVEKATVIHHIPKVLYSWRSHEASTATNPESKLYAYEAGKRAVASHLERQNVRGEVHATSNYGFYRVKYLPASGGNDGIYQESFINSLEKLNRQMNIKVVYYGRTCNKFVTFSQTGYTEDYVFFTCMEAGNLSSGFLEELMANVQRPDVGIACARVYDRHRRLSHDVGMTGVSNPFAKNLRGLKVGYQGYFHRAVLQQEITDVTDCFLMKREVLQKLTDAEAYEGKKGLPADELCRKVKDSGLKIVYDPWAVLYESR